MYNVNYFVPAKQSSLLIIETNGTKSCRTLKNVGTKAAGKNCMLFTDTSHTIPLKEPTHIRNWMSLFLRKNDDEVEPVISLPYIDEGNLGNCLFVIVLI